MTAREIEKGFWRRMLGEPKVDTHYYIKVICKNCKKIYEIEIPVKISVKDHLDKLECEYCKLTELTDQVNPFDSFLNKIEGDEAFT